MNILTMQQAKKWPYDFRVDFFEEKHTDSGDDDNNI